MEYIFLDNNLPEPLAKDKLNFYFREMKTNTKYRNIIIKHNIRFVIDIVNNRFKMTDYSISELVAVGIIGLIKSVDTFDHTRNISYLTYASKCIENEILVFMRNNKKHKNVESLDKIIVINSDLELTKEKLISEKMFSNINIVEDYEQQELYETINTIINDLPVPNKIIVEKYFGFNNSEPMNQQNIAKLLNLSQSYISRVLRITLEKIKNQLLEQKIIEINKVK